MGEDRVQRHLAAILAADVVGYSYLMERDEVGTLTALKRHRAELFDPTVAAYNGRIVKLMGDGALVEFASVTDAVQCAIDLQSRTAQRDLQSPGGGKIEFRIGINLGDVIVEGSDIYGDGVNVAARLEKLAYPSGICISGTVHDALGGDLAGHFEFLGEQRMKNIEKPVRAFRIAAAKAPASVATFAPPRKHSTPALAVKPFESTISEPEYSRFADGISNGVIIVLTRIPGLILIQDESAHLTKSSGMTVSELASRFDVRYVLKGSVSKYGNRFRVSAELVDVSTGRYLWAEQFDRDLRDFSELFGVQDEIVERIVTALDVKLLTGEASRLVRTSIKNPAALDCLYRGEQFLWSSSRTDLHESQRMFEEVIRLEPAASIGYAEAGLAYWAEAQLEPGQSSSRALERAVELSRQAVKLEDVSGYAHLIMAHVHLSRQQYREAEAEASQATLARPSCPAAYSLKAAVLVYLGRSAEAIEVAQHSMRLTPVVLPMHPAILATAYHGCERYKEAIDAATAAIEIDDQSFDAYMILAASNAAVGHTEEARRMAEMAMTLRPGLNLAEYAKSQPFKERRHLDRLLTQLRSAGIA